MSKIKIDKRLKRLVNTGICPYDDPLKYADELRELANEIANAEEAGKQSKFFKALGDATRLRILKLLEVREMCVCEIMIALGLTQPTTSHHLGILENVGLVRSRKEGKWVYYMIADPRLIQNLRRFHVMQ
ncbi:MAG: metalloregulator ArsR/SmtB family transcription factor [Candidatus Bathyarchaeia archaeon]